MSDSYSPWRRARYVCIDVACIDINALKFRCCLMEDAGQEFLAQMMRKFGVVNSKAVCWGVGGRFLGPRFWFKYRGGFGGSELAGIFVFAGGRNRILRKILRKIFLLR